MPIQGGLAWAMQGGLDKKGRGMGQGGAGSQKRRGWKFVTWRNERNEQDSPCRTSKGLYSERNSSIVSKSSQKPDFRRETRIFVRRLS